MEAALQQMATAIATLATNQATLTTEVIQVVQWLSNLTVTVNTPSQVSATKVVEKPAHFDGKGSEKARQFRNVFVVWAYNNPRVFGQYDTIGASILDQQGVHMYDGDKMITSALSFIDGDAAIWARPYIEKLAEEQHVFNSSWPDFIAAYKTKFEPINEQSEAQLQLSKIKQGKRKYSKYLSEFNT